MEEHFTSLVDYQFTAEMEDYLDQISRNERENLDYLQEFYFGDEKVAESVAPGGIGLKPLLALKVAEIDPRTACSYPLSTLADNQEIPVCVRVGRYGLYVNDGETNASLPKDISGDDLTFEQAVDLLAARAAAGGSKKKTKRSSAKKSTTKKKTTASKKAGKKAKPASDSDSDSDDLDLDDSDVVVVSAPKKKTTKAKKTSKKASKKK